MAFFDGELSERKSKSVTESIDKELEKEQGLASIGDQLNAYVEVREELQNWFSTSTHQNDGSPRSLNLWEGISQQLKDEGLLGGEEKGLGSRAALANRIREWFDLDYFRPPVLTAMGATAVVALLVGTWIGSASKSTSAPESAGLIAHSLTSVPQGASLSSGTGAEGDVQKERVNQDTIPMVSLVGSTSGRATNALGSSVGSRQDSASQFSRGEFVVSAPLAQENSGFRRPLRMHLETSQLIGSDALGKNGATVQGGLRTGRTHIDWIKSNHPVRIVPSQDRSAPPVIWIPRPTPKLGSDARPERP